MSDEGSAENEEERKERKSRVLHTRVPEVLEQELKRLAKSLKVPVSNVVRTILEDAIDTMEGVGKSATMELRGVAAKLRTEESEPRRAAPRFPLEGAIGVAPMKLVRAGVCGLSGQALPAGRDATLVHFDDGRPPLLVAPELVPASFTAGSAEEE